MMSQHDVFSRTSQFTYGTSFIIHLLCWTDTSKISFSRCGLTSRRKSLYQSSLNQVNSFRQFLQFLLVYMRLHPTVDGTVLLQQYHQIVLEAFCEDIGAKLNDSRCIECFQSFMREVVSK